MKHPIVSEQRSAQVVGVYWLGREDGLGNDLHSSNVQAMISSAC